jgi:hypothetical protein
MEKIHIFGGMKFGSLGFQPPAQNGTQFTTYKLFISGIFHLIFFSWPQVIETSRPETVNKEESNVFWKEITCSDLTGSQLEEFCVQMNHVFNLTLI